MHTHFWLCWFLPIATIANLGLTLPAWLELIGFAYFVAASAGLWRTIGKPPGALWAASFYRLALVLFVITTVATFAFRILNH